MTNVKSIAVTFQEAGWLMIIVLICATTIAAASILVLPPFKYLRQITSRYV